MAVPAPKRPVNSPVGTPVSLQGQVKSAAKVKEADIRRLIMMAPALVRGQRIIGHDGKIFRDIQATISNLRFSYGSQGHAPFHHIAAFQGYVVAVRPDAIHGLDDPVRVGCLEVSAGKPNLRENCRFNALVDVVPSYRETFEVADKKALVALRYRSEEDTDPQVTADKFDAEELRMNLKFSQLSTLKGLGLDVWQKTPNMAGVDRLLRRFRYWDDDVPHDDYFGELAD